MNRYLPAALAVFVAFVFVQSLAFKFTGSEETVIIFGTIAKWMADIGLPAGFAGGFGRYGGIVVGLGELTASGLVLVPRTRLWGAIIGWFVISGAIFFHLFTPLGINRVVDAAGNTDGGVLFMMACGVWLSCTGMIFLSRQQLLNCLGYPAVSTADSKMTQP